MLRKREIRRLLPANLQFVKFLWERPSEDSEVASLFALKSNREGTPRMGGDVVSDARNDFQNGSPIVTMAMNTRGAKEWEKLTGDSYNNQTGIAIVLDNKVYTAPGARGSSPVVGPKLPGTSPSTRPRISLTYLRAGKLPASAEIIQADGRRAPRWAKKPSIAVLCLF